MRVRYGHLTICKECGGTGFVAPPTGVRASWFPCEKCMGTGSLTGFDLSGRISLALRELALQRCACASAKSSPGTLGQECAIHALDFDAMANSVLEIIEKYK